MKEPGTKLGTKLDSQMKQLDTKLDSQMKQLGTKLNSQMKQLDSQMKALDTKLDIQMKQQESHLKALDKKIDGVKAELSAELGSKLDALNARFKFDASSVVSMGRAASTVLLPWVCFECRGLFIVRITCKNGQAFLFRA
jgi:septal ring factor EnvC (AmiA/AmiB activator)